MLCIISTTGQHSSAPNPKTQVIQKTPKTRSVPVGLIISVGFHLFGFFNSHVFLSSYNLSLFLNLTAVQYYTPNEAASCKTPPWHTLNIDTADMLITDSGVMWMYSLRKGLSSSPRDTSWAQHWQKSLTCEFVDPIGEMGIRSVTEGNTWKRDAAQRRGTSKWEKRSCLIMNKNQIKFRKSRTHRLQAAHFPCGHMWIWLQNKKLA